MGNDSSSNKDNIETILKSIESAKEIKGIVAKNEQEPPKLCCKDEDDVVKCLLSRNYIYLKTEEQVKKLEYMKNIGDCCSGSSPS